LIPLGAPALLDVYHALAFLPDSRRLGFVTRSRVVQFWDVVANRKAFALGHGWEFEGYHIATSPDGRLLAGEATVSAVSIWDLQTRECLYTLREEASPIWSLAFSPDGRKLAIGTSDGGLVVWDLRVIGSELAELGLDLTRDGAGR
jgi:WD40 repeat protein